MLFNSVYTIFWDFNIQCRVCYTACSVNRRETVSLFKFPIKSLMIPFELNWPVSLITIYILYVIITYWKPKIQCFRKLEYYIRSIKKDILNRNVGLLKSMFNSMHSILGWDSLCINYCINAAWHGGDKPVALLRCNGSPGCFDSGLQVICIFGSGVSHLPLDNNPYIFSMGSRSGEFAGQSSTVTPWSLNQLLSPLAVWAGAKSCWEMKSASP